MDNIYLNTLDKTKCSGCRACEHICAFGAINMDKDEEGFLYPLLDASKCVNCGMCGKVCPISNPPEKKVIREIYALQYKDRDALLRSSSGGVFIGIARKIIENGGIVFGCIFNENNEAVIVGTDKYDLLDKMQGSKYVSSDTRDSYTKAKKYLDDGKTVFFTGAPCQVAGLKSFLKKPYENLFTMDFLCHGMPSHDFFEENIKFIQDKRKGALSRYQFRDKSFKGWGHVTSYVANGKKYFEPGKINAYFNGFINGYLNRYSCYECHFRGDKRIADITVGDFWGCDLNTVNIENGISFASINTENGNKILNEILTKEFFIEPTTIDKVGKQNSSINSEEKEIIPEIRKKIYSELYESGYIATRKKYLIPKDYLQKKIVNKIPKKLKKLLISLLTDKKQ